MRIREDYIETLCPITKQTEKVYYRTIPGTPLISCQGCDNSHGNPNCKKCIADTLEQLKSTTD